ncbi:MAG: response regulator [Deltaproteobacteria bacterium]|nr:response regulator [Deltaproteobacteria bacterium]
MGKKILLAEDSSTIRKVFELAFARSDISLTMVENGNDAVRLARETAPDLVVADVTLPDRDGFQVAEELGASGKGCRCPVLILSGTLFPFDEEKFRKCGARGVLFKPFESRELAEKVLEMLEFGEEEAAAAKEKAEPPPGEPWDFSDVMEEVDKEGGAPAEVPQHVEDFLPGSPRGTQVPQGGLSLGEFDVSIEDIEKSPSGEPAADIEGNPLADAPPAVTDIETALEAAEELEELENLEEVDLLDKEAAKPAPPEPGPGAESGPRAQFSGRAQEIFEKVAAEAVEKVMWEFMERFSAEFSQRIRESVEAVAWEVIPPTAEALIREEIARIRERTEKKSS